MTNYAFYPVTGDGLTQATGYTWNVGPINFDTGSDWALVSSLGTVQLGVPPTTGTVPTTGDSIGLLAGAIAPGALNFYTPNPAKGDPYINSTNFPVDAVLNSGTLSLDNLVLAGFNTYASLPFIGSATPLFPTLDVESANLAITGSILDTGTATFPTINLGIFGTISSATASGGGTIDLGKGARVTLDGTAPADIKFNFNDALGDTLVLPGVTTAAPTSFLGTITGFQNGDSIALTGIPAVGTTGTYNITTGVLTLTVGDPTQIQIKLAGPALTSSNVHVVPTANGVEIVACFAAGTRILTPSGPVPVERLRAGDHVVACEDEGRSPHPVRWIGYRHIDLRRHRAAGEAMPVRIRRGAFGPNLPARALVLSGNHAIFAEGVLVPARYLVDGVAIAWAHDLDQVTYYHIELDAHRIVLAEGLPAETLVPGADQSAFANGGTTVRLHPDFNALLWDGEGCAPLVVTGKEVEAIRSRLARRARRGAPRTRPAPALRKRRG